MRFRLGISTIRFILDTHHLNIIGIISCLEIFFFFLAILPLHHVIYTIILLGIGRTAEPLMLYFIEH